MFRKKPAIMSIIFVSVPVFRPAPSTAGAAIVALSPAAGTCAGETSGDVPGPVVRPVVGVTGIFVGNTEICDMAGTVGVVISNRVGLLAGVMVGVCVGTEDGVS